MPLCRKSPTLTPARLAALRANAQKSTGPRTRRGKARSALNGFRHGRYSRRLPELLARAGDRWGQRQYAWIHAQIRIAFRRSGERTRRTLTGARLAAVTLLPAPMQETYPIGGGIACAKWQDSGMLNFWNFDAALCGPCFALDK